MHHLFFPRYLFRFGSYFLAGLRRKFIEAGGITFSYYEREATPSPQQTTDDGGVAAPPPVTLVFVHGFSASKIMWTSMVPHFPSEWRIVMMDMPGHGESSFISGEDYSSKGMARKLHDVSLTGGKERGEGKRGELVWGSEERRGNREES